MALYLIGDIQGCLTELKALLVQVSFNKTIDELWFAGDLVARGPDSLGTLRFIKSLGESAKIVLGNHDLHLLAVHAGVKKVNPKDNLSELLSAPDVDELMTWLASQPLLRQLPGNISKTSALNHAKQAFISHAGISPQWTLDEAIAQANTAQQYLSSVDRKKWLALMYGDHANNWFKVSGAVEKFRYTINAFTRMRYCLADESLEFKLKNSPAHTSDDFKPWYDLSKVVKQTTWFFGHWASLMGNCPQTNVYALDTGCVWGNHLTMVRFDDMKIFTEKAH